MPGSGTAHRWKDKCLKLRKMWRKTLEVSKLQRWKWFGKLKGQTVEKRCVWVRATGRGSSAASHRGSYIEYRVRVMNIVYIYHSFQNVKNGRKLFTILSLLQTSANRKQVENMAKRKLDSLLKESKIRDREDPDSFTITALPPAGKDTQKNSFKVKDLQWNQMFQQSVI